MQTAQAVAALHAAAAANRRRAARARYGVFEGMLYQDIQQQYRKTSPAGRRAISKP
jgi:probable phosphoglycerate mutase